MCYWLQHVTNNELIHNIDNISQTLKSFNVSICHCDVRTLVTDRSGHVINLHLTYSSVCLSLPLISIVSAIYSLCVIVLSTVRLWTLHVHSAELPE